VKVSNDKLLFPIFLSTLPSLPPYLVAPVLVDPREDHITRLRSQGGSNALMKGGRKEGREGGRERMGEK